MTERFSQEQFDRYLRLLGVERQPASFEYLRSVVKQQLYQVPFENISKLYWKKTGGLSGLVQFETHLDGIEKFGFGGTCYANNYYLNRLLDHLGFSIRLCGADMNEPDVHLVNLVDVEGKGYLVDVGYGAPFDEPMPTDLGDDLVISLGNEQYRLKPRTKDGISEMQHLRDEEQIHGYRVNPTGREIAHFEQVIADSFKDDSTFMRNIRADRFGADRVISIRNLEVTSISGEGIDKQTIPNKPVLAQFLSEYLGMPFDRVQIAVEDIQLG